MTALSRFLLLRQGGLSDGGITNFEQTVKTSLVLSGPLCLNRRLLAETEETLPSLLGLSELEKNINWPRKKHELFLSFSC